MDILAKRTAQKYNLGPGEPVEIAKALESVAEGRGQPGRWSDYSRYPWIGGDPALVGLIRTFAKRNGLPYKGDVVVTNGGKQGLSAALYALRKTQGGFDMGTGTITHWGPYWPTLPSICALAGLRVTTRIGTGVYGIVTSPNNPDGRQYQPSWGHSHFGLIWDAAYASPAYGWNGFWTPSHAKVFSLSKLFGVPGLRVGWVLFDDEAQAADARAYVEVTTSGVNVFAQSAEAASILTHFGEHPKEYERFCRDVRRRLEDNRTTLDEALLPYVDDHGARTGGMYYWCLVKKGYWRRFKQALAKADIGHVPGEACGAGMSHLYRFNLAQDRAVVKEAAAQLAELMRKP